MLVRNIFAFIGGRAVLGRICICAEKGAAVVVYARAEGNAFVCKQRGRKIRQNREPVLIVESAVRAQAAEVVTHYSAVSFVADPEIDAGGIWVQLRAENSYGGLGGIASVRMPAPHGMADLVYHGKAVFGGAYAEQTIGPVSERSDFKRMLGIFSRRAVFKGVAESYQSVGTGIYCDADYVRAEVFPCGYDFCPLALCHGIAAGVDQFVREDVFEIDITISVAKLCGVGVDTHRSGETEREFVDAGIRQADVHFVDSFFRVRVRSVAAVCGKPFLRGKIVCKKNVYGGCAARCLDCSL